MKQRELTAAEIAAIAVITTAFLAGGATRLTQEVETPRHWRHFTTEQQVQWQIDNPLIKTPLMKI